MLTQQLHHPLNILTALSRFLFSSANSFSSHTMQHCYIRNHFPPFASIHVASHLDLTTFQCLTTNSQSFSTCICGLQSLFLLSPYFSIASFFNFTATLCIYLKLHPFTFYSSRALISSHFPANCAFFPSPLSRICHFLSHLNFSKWFCSASLFVAFGHCECQWMHFHSQVGSLNLSYRFSLFFSSRFGCHFNAFTTRWIVAALVVYWR